MQARRGVGLGVAGMTASSGVAAIAASRRTSPGAKSAGSATSPAASVVEASGGGDTAEELRKLRAEVAELRKKGPSGGSGGGSSSQSPSTGAEDGPDPQALAAIARQLEEQGATAEADSIRAKVASLHQERQSAKPIQGQIATATWRLKILSGNIEKAEGRIEDQEKELKEEKMRRDKLVADKQELEKQLAALHAKAAQDPGESYKAPADVPSSAADLLGEDDASIRALPGAASVLDNIDAQLKRLKEIAAAKAAAAPAPPGDVKMEAGADSKGIDFSDAMLDGLVDIFAQAATGSKIRAVAADKDKRAALLAQVQKTAGGWQPRRRQRTG